MALSLLLRDKPAQQHGAGVIHVDRHYDVLATVLAFSSLRA